VFGVALLAGCIHWQMTMKVAFGETLFDYLRMTGLTALARDAEPRFMALATLPFKFSMGTVTGE